MKGSHTTLLINEAFEKIQEFNYKRYINELVNISQNTQKAGLSGLKHSVNQVLEKFGLHLMYKSVFEELENNSYNKMGKWSSVGTLQLALRNPEKFDEVYNLFSDEESKATFDWFIKYRVAYAFLGEFAGEIFPAKITKSDFLKEVKRLKSNWLNGLITIGKFSFKSDEEETVESWILDQYNLEKKCEISEGDYVIDGGAYKGETSLWFLSKGAGKVYAFEPDPYNFSVLLDNINRNGVSNKIIPIKKILSDKNKDFSFLCTNSAGSTVIVGSNEVIEGVTLDTFVEKERLDRVDFIKFDVEGAELEILEGAAETIKEFKPKMAISIYHKPDDIILLPKFVSGILPDAKLYLSHRSYDWIGTVLFVNPRDWELL